MCLNSYTLCNLGTIHFCSVKKYVSEMSAIFKVYVLIAKLSLATQRNEKFQNIFFESESFHYYYLAAMMTCVLGRNMLSNCIWYF